MKRAVKKAYIKALRLAIKRKSERISSLGIHLDEVMLSMTLEEEIKAHKLEIKRVNNL